MPMSDIRKKAQDKLRKKFGYSTNDNYGRGTILYRQDSESHKIYSNDEYGITYDINIVMNNRLFGSQKPIEICTTQYADYGKDVPEDKRYKKLHEHTAFLSLEELDLIHAIAHQMAEENDWDLQIKEWKKKRKATQ